MRHVIAWQGQKLKVSLPDAVPDGVAFPFAVDGVSYEATWHRGHGVLAVTDEAGVETILRVRACGTSRFDGESETEVRAEVGAGPRVSQILASVGYDVPGQAGRATTSREQVVRSQITGKVLKVMVRAGETVTQGQTLLTIEAMKMENRVFAAAPGHVASVSVKDGDAVSTGKELVRIAP